MAVYISIHRCIHAALETGGDFLFVCKKDSHKTLYEFPEGVPLGDRAQARQGQPDLSLPLNGGGVPLRDGKDALNVNWLGITTSKDFFHDLQHLRLYRLALLP